MRMCNWVICLYEIIPFWAEITVLGQCCPNDACHQLEAKEMLYLLKTMIMWHITALKTNTITYESCLLLQSCVKQGDLSINQIDTLGDFQLKITQI